MNIGRKKKLLKSFKRNQNMFVHFLHLQTPKMIINIKNYGDQSVKAIFPGLSAHVVCINFSSQSTSSGDRSWLLTSQPNSWNDCILLLRKYSITDLKKWKSFRGEEKKPSLNVAGGEECGRRVGVRLVSCHTQLNWLWCLKNSKLVK